MRAPAPAKINLALVVGPTRGDGKHEVVTVYQRVGLVDRIEVEPAASFRVDGFLADTLVRSALEALAARAGVEPRWRAVPCEFGDFRESGDLESEFPHELEVFLQRHVVVRCVVFVGCVQSVIRKNRNRSMT